MNTWLAVLVLLSTVSLSVTLCPGQTIDTFPFLELFGISRLYVGPEGDIWFSLANTTRLMRGADDEIQCVYDSGLMWSGLYDICITPDGTIWLSHGQEIYYPEVGLWDTDFQVPVGDGNCWFLFQSPTLTTCDCSLYFVGAWNSSFSGRGPDRIYELVHGGMAEIRYEDQYAALLDLDPVLLVSSRECWAFASYSWGGGTYAALRRINLEAGTLEAEYPEAWVKPYAKDSQGLLWLTEGPSIMTFDGGSFSTFAEGDSQELWYRAPVLGADGAVWSVEANDDPERATQYLGISRFRAGQKRTLTVDDGLISNWCESPVIDYDGRLWVVNRQRVEDPWFGTWYAPAGLSRITDGGWPPMRLSLQKLETPERIAVEANVINNGPVVGVDVYIALELNGQLLFYPTWGPEPFPNQVNLRPGHNQTATIIELPKAQVPPGSYTFFGCMTGRNTQKLIGPIDRKFESITVEVNG